MHLTVSLAGSGFHPASWRVSTLPAVPSAAAFRAMAETAERGGLDAVLLGLPDAAPGGVGAANTMRLDPLPLLGALIAATERIGLGAAWTIDFTEPYNVARVFATLDHLSHGRTAWIVGMHEAAALAPLIGRPVATDDEAAYCRRAGEFVDVVKGLWDSWEDAAFALDTASGMFVDPARVHPIEHAGAFFAVRGPLNVPRPPQGNPVLILADPAAAAGRQFAAQTADAILTDCGSLAEACARQRELRALAAGELRVLANVQILLGDTETAARQRAAALDALSPPGAGGLRFVGTEEQLVDLFALWLDERACDGFNLLPAVLPDDLDFFVERAVPLARSRGLVGADCAGATLREHLGLARPRGRFAGSAAP